MTATQTTQAQLQELFLKLYSDWHKFNHDEEIWKQVAAVALTLEIINLKP